MIFIRLFTSILVNYVLLRDVAVTVLFDFLEGWWAMVRPHFLPLECPRAEETLKAYNGFWCSELYTVDWGNGLCLGFGNTAEKRSFRSALEYAMALGMQRAVRRFFSIGFGCG